MVVDAAANLGQEMRVGEYFVRKLRSIGIRHIFGVPGDFVLGVCRDLVNSEIEYVGCCNELNAAYAADGYARVNGVGCILSTYVVGELSAINGVAGAYAEDVPVVVITGCPKAEHYEKKTLLHHTIGDYTTPRKMFDYVTAASCLLMSANDAKEQIDATLAARVTEKKPVYVGICSDVVDQVIDRLTDRDILALERRRDPFIPLRKAPSDSDAMQEVLWEVRQRLEKSSLPLFIPGLEMRRFNLEETFATLVKNSGIPYATMMLGKAVINEDSPQYLGVYRGRQSKGSIRTRVRHADCIVLFGEKLTDFNTGGFSQEFEKSSLITVNKDHIQVAFHRYDNVFIEEFMKELLMVCPRKDLEKAMLPMSSTDGATITTDVSEQSTPSKEIKSQTVPYASVEDSSDTPTKSGSETSQVKVDDNESPFVERERADMSTPTLHEKFSRQDKTSKTSRKKYLSEECVESQLEPSAKRKQVATGKSPPYGHATLSTYTSRPQVISLDTLLHHMENFLPENCIFICETGTAMFAAVTLKMPRGATFIAQTYYGSIGYTLGACLGACVAAPDRAVILVIGDGSLQMTCQELSTIIRINCKPTIFVLNNDGYTIERVILDGAFNDIQPWKYYALPEMFGGTQKGIRVKSEEELQGALKNSEDLFTTCTVVEVMMDRMDCPESLRQSGREMALNNNLL